jgi:hypothetical protein
LSTSSARASSTILEVRQFATKGDGRRTSRGEWEAATRISASP